MHTREDILERLKPFMLEHPKVLAVWEGGSAATNHIDAYSDVDLMVVTDKTEIEALFEEFEVRLNETFGIVEKYRVKEPAWHGFSQCFYHLETTEPWLYLDLCILPKEIDDHFTASDRHGEAKVWKDTIGFIKNDKTPEAIYHQRLKRYYESATASEFILRLEIDKAFRREQFIDAYEFMHAYIIRHLAPLLNIEHRPAKVDFGLRYAQREYSTNDYTLLLSFYRSSSLNELEKVLKLILSRFETLKTQFVDLV